MFVLYTTLHIASLADVVLLKSHFSEILKETCKRYHV